MDLATAEPPAAIRAVDGNDPEETFFASIVDAKVLETIDTLQNDFREVVVLSDVENLSYVAIAGVLGISVGTVKSRLFRARRLLQKALYDEALDMGYVRARAEARLARCARGAPIHSIGR